MQIHLQATQSLQGLFDLLYQCRSDSSVSLMIIDCQRVDPASVSVVAAQYGADHPAIRDCDQEEVGIAGGLLPDG